jgi:hypothetical protein
MKYYLTEDQWNNLPVWNISKNSNSLRLPDIQRVPIFREYMQSTFNLKYDELLGIANTDIPGYWGFIEGEEKHITWFLLSL